MPGTNLYDFLTKAILRLGAVLLAVFVIQLLFPLVRYRIKLSDELEHRADFIELGFEYERNIDFIKAIALAQSINMDAMPDHPYGKFADTIKVSAVTAARLFSLTG
ncbi:hypothetical protein [Rhodovulum imhoffii]|uniref:hypothetical protein n=1 Tax=Rhodovulum imhoffii TaxID=365340 RepID=UPI0011B1EA30|nr:hypothetical protein [Rhodovulum imhoffii]